MSIANKLAAGLQIGWLLRCFCARFEMSVRFGGRVWVPNAALDQGVPVGRGACGGGVLACACSRSQVQKVSSRGARGWVALRRST